jgi:hypothetical protein
MRGGVIACSREAAEPGRGGARVQAVDEADGVVHAGLLDQQPSSRSTPASSCSLIASTTSLTGALFSTISPTLAITSSSPA